MDTIKIRLTVDVEYKFTEAQRARFITESSLKDVATAKFPDNIIFGVLGEGAAEAITDRLHAGGIALLRADYLSSFSVKPVTYQEAVIIPPPANVNPLTVNLGDRNKP